MKHPIVVLIAGALVGCQCGAPQPPVAGPETEVEAPPTAPATFSFEQLTTPEAVALNGVMRAVLAVPESAAAYEANREALRRAQQQLRDNGPSAAALLQADLDGRSDLDLHAWGLGLLLLAETRTDGAVDYLAAQARRPTETTRGDEGVEFGALPVDRLRRVRVEAVEQLGRMAAVAQPRARAALLELAAQGAAEVRVRAVATYLRVSPERWRAKRELVEALPPGEEHLVHSSF